MALIINKPITTASTNNTSLLGSLVYYKVGELEIPKTELEKIFNNAGLSSTKYDVTNIRPSDAMRRATSKLKNRQITIDYNGEKKTAYIDIAESSLGKEVLRYIGRKVVDDKGKKVCYDQISTMVYDRGLTSLSHLTIDPTFQLEYDYDNMLNEVEQIFQVWVNNHTQDTVRNIVTKVIGSLHPTKIKVNNDDDAIARFIPVKYNKELMSLKQVLKDLAPYHKGVYDSGIQLIDMFDSDSNRDLLANSIKNDISGRVQDLVSDLADTLKTKGSITQTTAISLVDKLKEMKAEALEYSELLKTGMDILTLQIHTALNKVEEIEVNTNVK